MHLLGKHLRAEIVDRESEAQIKTLVNDIAPDLADDDLTKLYEGRTPLAYPKFDDVKNVELPPDLGDITVAGETVVGELP